MQGESCQKGKRARKVIRWSQKWTRTLSQFLTHLPLLQAHSSSGSVKQINDFQQKHSKCSNQNRKCYSTRISHICRTFTDCIQVKEVYLCLCSMLKMSMQTAEMRVFTLIRFGAVKKMWLVKSYTTQFMHIFYIVYMQLLSTSYAIVSDFCEMHMQVCGLP